MPIRPEEDGVAARPDVAAAAVVWDPSVLADIGAPEDTVEILAMFVEQVDERLPLLRDAIERGDDGQIHELAHFLKGSAATVGAQRLAAVCDALCRTAVDGQAETASALYSRLTETWEDTAHATGADAQRS